MPDRIVEGDSLAFLSPASPVKAMRENVARNALAVRTDVGGKQSRTKKQFFLEIASAVGWSAVQADPSILCWDQLNVSAYITARRNLGDSWNNQTLSLVSEVVGKLPKFIDLATTSSLDVLQKYADAHALDVALGGFPPKKRFGELVRALLRWKLGDTPGREAIIACGWPCDEISFELERSENDIYRDMGVAVKKWVRDHSNDPLPLTMMQFFNQLTPLRIDNQDVVVHKNAETEGINVHFDAAGCVHVLVSDKKELDLTNIKKAVTTFIERPNEQK